MLIDINTVIGDPSTNTSVGTAFNLDPYFSLEFDGNIESGPSSNHSTIMPHASALAKTEVGVRHFYAFTVGKAGDMGVFDTDFAEINGLDTHLRLFDTDGIALLDENDDSPFVGPGDVFVDTFNSFLIYQFDVPGLYFLEVSQFDDVNGIVGQDFSIDGAGYTLHVSLGVPEPSTWVIWSMMMAGAVYFGRRKRRRRD